MGCGLGERTLMGTEDGGMEILITWIQSVSGSIGLKLGAYGRVLQWQCLSKHLFYLQAGGKTIH